MNEEMTKEAFLEVIRIAIDRQFAGSIASATKAWGVNYDNLYKWLRGDRSPRLENLIPILKKIGAQGLITEEELDKYSSLKYIMGQDGTKNTDDLPAKTGEANKQLPVYNINCVTPTRDEAKPISHMTPCPQFPEADYAIYLEDYSVMKNSLPEGSVIGIKAIDHRANFIKSGHIYLMWWEHEGLVVRYAYLDQATKMVKCIADHMEQDKFPPQEFPVEQAQKFTVGRVVWCMARV